MSEPRFGLGERVQVVRILDGITSVDLIGMHGTVEEVESLPPPMPPYWAERYGNVEPTQHNYEVRLDETGHTHYLNQQMLEPA
jgi:hypothetical protein